MTTSTTTGTAAPRSAKRARPITWLALAVAFSGCAHQQHALVAPRPLPPALPQPEPLPLVSRPEPVLLGRASYYHGSLAGRRTASGERYDPRALTAAHRALPFGTCLEVTRVDDGRHVRVRVNDRGPYVRGRILDLSHEAARRLGMLEAGVAHVQAARCPDARAH